MRPDRPTATALAAASLLAAAVLLFGGQTEDPRHLARADAPAPRVAVPRARIRYDDGDTFVVLWPSPKAPETIRVLGIDTPEIRHLEHDLPYGQPFGREASGFLRGCFAVADRIELVRAAERDPYGRTLAYVYLDGKNYSALVVRARLAVESVSHFGDNGLPGPAAEVLAAAKQAGPVAFEAPFRFRRRMRAVSAWMRAHGTYPSLPERASPPGRGGK